MQAQYTKFVIKFTLLRGAVAQLVRALPCHGRGQGFESPQPRINN